MITRAGVGWLESSDGRDDRAPWPGPADLFNGYVGASVVLALDQIGALAALHDGPVDLGRLAGVTGTEPARLQPLVTAALRLGLVAPQDAGLSLTAAGREQAANAGYFIWALGGYGDVFANLAPWARGEKRFGVEIRRDPAMVALGSSRCDEALMAPVFFEVLDGVAFTCIADLGCGNAARLIRVLERYPGRAGLGVEISPEACAAARQRISAAGVGDRIHVHQGDATRFEGDPELRQRVDLVTSFLLAHDLFASVDPPESLFARLRETFPNARRFLIADTNLTASPPPPPIHSVAFELVHGVMGIPIHKTDAYERIFAAAGLDVRARVPFGVPNTWLYVLEVR